jgi:PAS domain S-box-containing protein
MRLALAAGGVLLLALLTWLLLRGINTNASAYAETQRAFDDFALAEASVGRDVLQARAGLLGNYDVLVEAEAAMENAVGRIRQQVQAENLDPKPAERLAAAVGQYEDLIERFKTSNSLRQNSLLYVGQLSTDPAFGALGDQSAASATALGAAVLRLARDSSAESARSLQQQIDRFEAQAPAGGPDGEAAHALLAHARLLGELLPEADQTLRDLVAFSSRQPLEETRELVDRAQAAFEVTAQRFQVLLYVVSLALLVAALRLGVRLWTRTLKFRRLVDANIIGIFIFAADGRILEANDTFLRIVGYDRDDLRSGRLRRTDLTPSQPLDRDQLRSPPEPELTRSSHPTEMDYVRKDGSRVPVLSGAASFEEHGREGVAFVLDLTELKRAEAEAHESERRERETHMELAHANRLATMGQLTASIAHEVNNPIAATLINAETALRWLTGQQPNVERATQALHRIVQDGNRAAGIIDGIRALIRKAPARREDLRINETIMEVVAVIRGEILKNGVSLQMQLADNLPLIEGDRVQLQQVALNLMVNAVEAMGKSGDDRRELLISTQPQPGCVLVSIRDSGPGLSQADLDRVFDAFYTTKSSGLGMGLSICRSIVEAHGGRLWAAPNVPKGAAFQFTLPLHADCSEPAPMQAGEGRDPLDGAKLQ